MDENTNLELENETGENSVSNEEVQVTWQAPTEEEYKNALKAAVNKANTSILRQLGVKSVKEFLDYKQSLENDKRTYEDLIKEKDSYADELKKIKEDLNKANESLLAKELNIPDEYKEDLLEIARKGVSDEVDLKTSLTNLVNTKYKFLISGNTGIQIGTQRTVQKQPTEVSGVMREFLKNNPDIKFQN